MSRATKFFVAVGTVIGIAIVFFLGFGLSVYWSLRSAEVKVPDVVGKDRFVAENELTEAGLKFRERAVRPSNQLKADSILFQLPRAGEIVKAGQTVAVDISRPAKEGEASDTVNHADNTNTAPANDNANATPSPVANRNENKPKRTRNSNSNANGNNANGNTNGNAKPGNHNANSNRPKQNTNNGNANVEGNANRRTNSNRTGEANNQNSNRPKGNANRTKPQAQPTPPE